MTFTHVYMYLHTDIKKDGIAESAKAFTWRASVVDELPYAEILKMHKDPCYSLGLSLS